MTSLPWTICTLGFSLWAGALAGCASIAIGAAPEKVAAHDDSPEAKAADAMFWSTLHGGHYDQIGPAIEGLQAAYLVHPNDPKTAAHIGFLHIWRISESARLDRVPATITDDMVLARRYFDEAVKLDPDEARFRGFLAATMLAEGKIHADEKLTRRGFFTMKDAVTAWPEFNLFTSGYTMSILPPGDEHYVTAVEQQWDNLDACANGQRIDRTTADYAPVMHLETHTGPKRACWDSWIAPHNLEGFFLNMGDMLVKAGDPTMARRVYAQAKLNKGYASWPYREVLERRIADADANVAVFRAPPAADGSNHERRIMFESPFACMGCHQE
jgi:hypothetical protein